MGSPGQDVTPELELRTMSTTTGVKMDTDNHIAVKVNRQVYDEGAFAEGYEVHPRHPPRTLHERVDRAKSRVDCSGKRVLKSIIGLLPFIGILKSYRPPDAFADLISGFTVGVMHIPQGMAYALLANVKPHYGLYVSFWPVIIYFFFGTSRHISMGTFAVVCLMVGAVVSKNLDGGASSPPPCVAPTPVYNFTTSLGTTAYMTTATMNGTATTTPAPGESERDLKAIEIAVAVTFLVGLMQLGMGILRLGFVSIYLSEPLTRGFTTGAAMHVMTSQIKYIFGIEVKRYNGPLKLVYTYIDFFRNIANTKWEAIVISVICIVILAFTKEIINPKVKAKIKAPVPIELIVVIAGTVTSYFLNLKQRIRVVGTIPNGMPTPKVPNSSYFSTVVADALPIAIIAFVVSVAMSKLFAKKHNYSVDANQELVAYGITNAASSFFNCFVSCASLSRSLVQENVAGLVSSVLLLVVILWLGPLFEPLPNAVLASIILVALKGMFKQFMDLKMLWFISKIDFLVWSVMFLSVVLLDVSLGFIVGLGFGLLTVVFRTQRPYTSVLGRIPNTDIYNDVKVVPVAEQFEGIKIFRFEASLYYANCEYFTERLFKKSGVNPRALKIKRAVVDNKKKQEEKRLKKLVRERQKRIEKTGNPELEVDMTSLEANNWSYEKTELKTVIIDCATMGYVDYMGVNLLGQIIKEYKDVDINVYLAACKAGVREMLEAAGFFDKIPKSALFVSVHDAVLRSLQKDMDSPDSPLLLEDNNN